MSKLAVTDNPIRQSTVLNARARQEQEWTEVQTL